MSAAEDGAPDIIAVSLHDDAVVVDERKRVGCCFINDAP